MKNLKLTSLICGGFVAMAGSSLLAQQSATDPNQQSPSSASQSSSTTLGTSSGGVGASATSRGSMHSGSNVRLSDIINKPVQSKEGKTLGYIRDLTVDPQSGRIEFAILSLSSAGAATDTSTSGRETAPSSRSSVTGTPSSAAGATTMGKLIPVPWQLFSQSWSGSHLGSTTTPGSATAPGSSMASQSLVLNIDESKLRSAPSFDSSNWNELQTGTFDQRVYSYFGVDRTSGTGTPGSSIQGQGSSGTYDPNRPATSGPQDRRTEPKRNE